jgi:xylose dehydrogenase (NAD/NADP)
MTPGDTADTTRRIRAAVIGAGRIAQNAIAPAMRAARNVEFVAAASRDVVRAQSLGAQRSYSTYEELLDDPDVEMVFITTHNGLHRELTLDALRKGKHVLCEKPLAPTVAECEEMVAESERSGRRLMEAFMYRYHPQIDALRQAVLHGWIGDVRHVSAAFHFHLSRTDDVRLDPTIGGGALLDVGCYCVNISRLLLGEDVVGVTASARMGPSGVDIEGKARLAFASGPTADITWGFEGPMRQQVIVTGTKGNASLNWAFSHRGEPHALEISAGAKTRRKEYGKTDVYQLEIEDFAAAILEGREPLLSADEGLKNARVLTRIAESMRA